MNQTNRQSVSQSRQVCCKNGDSAAVSHALSNKSTLNLKRNIALEGKNKNKQKPTVQCANTYMCMYLCISAIIIVLDAEQNHDQCLIKKCLCHEHLAPFLTYSLPSFKFLLFFFCCSELYLADVACTLFNSFLICGTMLPLSIYSAKILLQVQMYTVHACTRYTHVAQGCQPYFLCERLCVELEIDVY